MSKTTPTPPHATSSALLGGTGLDHEHVLATVRAALAEDLAWGPDITTLATIPSTARGTAHVIARATGTIAGMGVAAAVVELLHGMPADQERAAEVAIYPHVGDGDRVSDGQPVLTINGPVRLLLTAERTLLNFLCQLSGVATETARWVHALAAVELADRRRPKVKVRDTRKTVPGMRVLQKYAVRCGGGVNHRMGLGDAALIKDNHIAAVGSLTKALEAVRAQYPTIPVEVECDTLAQVNEALTAGADLILLDNMDLYELTAAARLARPYPAKLEASGGLTLEQVGALAATGIDYIALGALTHSAPALDLGVDLDPVEPTTRS